MSIGYASNGPTDPQPNFGFYVNYSSDGTLYTSPFVDGGYYTSLSADVAIWLLTQQLMSSPDIFLAVYEGVPGDAQLVEYDYGPTPPVSVVYTSPNDWSGIEGAPFFAVAMGYTDFSEVLAENTFLTQGTGTAPDPFSIVQFKWGVPPVSDPAVGGPTLVSLLSISANGVEVQSNLAYVAAGSSGLQIYDVSNPSSPNLIGEVSYDAVGQFQAVGGVAQSSGYAESITVDGHYGYLLDSTGGLEIIDVSNSSQPQLVGHYTPAPYDPSNEAPLTWLAVSGQFAYLAEIDGAAATPTGRVEIVNISNPVNPTLVDTFNLGSQLPDSVIVSGNYMYLTVGTEGSGNQALELIDISNPSAPHVVGAFSGATHAQAVELQGNLAYVADAFSGLLIYDDTNPTNPVLIGRYAGGFSNVQLDGNIAYLAGMDLSAAAQDFVEVNISDPTHPTFLGSVTLPGWTGTLGFNGSDVYVPYDNWLYVVQSASISERPVINAADSIRTGAVAKTANATTSASLDYANSGSATTPSGVIAFTDQDTTARPTASIDTADETVTYQGSGGQIYSLTSAQIQTFETAFQIAPESGNTNNGKIDWTYGIPNSALPFLGAGETITLTVPVVISDGSGGTVTQNVVVTINGANDNPVAKPVSVKVENSGSVYDTTAATGVLASDSDPNIHDTLYISAVDGLSADVGHSVAGKYGTVTLNADGSYSYVENLLGKLLSDFHISATDSFSYTVSDGHGGAASSTLSFNTLEALPPVAKADIATVGVDATLSEDAASGVLANDTDPNGYSLIVTSVSTATGLGGGPETVPVSSILPGVISGKYGTLTLNADGSYSYVETAASVPKGAHDVFSYSVSDAHGGTASSTLTVDVTAPPPSPYISHYL